MFKLGQQILKHQLRIRWLSLDSRLIEGSLTSRFHEYINQNTKKPEIITSINSKLSHLERHDYQQATKLVDSEFMKVVQKNVKFSELIKYLDFTAQYLPHQLLNMKFYDEALKLLTNNDAMCKKHFIKLCYYIGYFKKFNPGPKYLRQLFDKCLNDMLIRDKLTKMDLAIISISAYKTSVRLTNDKFHERIIREIVETNDTSDPFMLVAFIKSLKHNMISSKEVLDKLKNIIEQVELDYHSLVHILPYVVETNLKSDDLIKLICERCIKSFDENARAKDVQKFLHSCALLNLKIPRSDLEKCEQMIIGRLKNSEFATHFDHFVNAALSLWILDYHSFELVSTLLEDRRFNRTGSYSRIKLDSRMKLLETCVEIERPKWLKNNVRTKFSSFVFNRPSPGFLIKSSLEQVMNLNDKDKSAIYVQQIKNLNIAGILTVDRNGNFTHHEVLDKGTTLADKKSPNGIFQLKLRLLEKSNCKVEIVSIL